MKNLRYLLLGISILSMHIAFSQGICNPAGNIIIYSNYDGGSLSINIDENIPDIKIGICSYEAIDVTITGTYVSNVSEVLYAGFNDDPGSSITGVDAGIVTFLTTPPVTLYDADGYPFIICAYECDTDFIPGGCNTVDQLSDYFLTTFTGSLRYSFMQYGVWGTGTYVMSDGGNCCVGINCTTVINAGQDQTICGGDTAYLNAVGGISYSWTPADFVSDPLSANPFTSPFNTTTFIVTGTNADGCSGIDTVTVSVLPGAEAAITSSGSTLYATGGTGFQWLLNGIIIPDATDSAYTAIEAGSYSVLVTNAEGCSDVSDSLNIIVNSIYGTTQLLPLIIFPAPASGYIILNANNGLYGEMHIQIFDYCGMKKKDLTLYKPATSLSLSIPVADMPSGIYFLTITSGNVLISAENFVKL